MIKWPGGNDMDARDWFDAALALAAIIGLAYVAGVVAP